MKKIKYKLILILIIAFIAILPNFSKAATVSVNQVKNLKVTATSTSAAKIKWSKVSNASGYRIYLYNASTKEYEYYKSTSSTNIKIKNLQSSQGYKIKIRAYKTVKEKKYYGKYSSVLKFATNPEAVKNVTMVAETDKNIKITWNKVSRASGYRVYIINQTTNQYEYYGYSKTNSIKIKNLQSATTYKVRVRAYKTVNGVNYFGAYSPKTKITTLPIKISKLNVKEKTLNTITLSWDKSERAAGYRIYKYNSTKKAWTFCADTTDLSYEVKKLNAGTEYIFKIRPFINFNGKRYYGGYSDTINVSTLVENFSRPGIDVSKWQEEIDWQKVKDSGIELAIIRAGYRGRDVGGIYEDDYFQSNIEQATKLGLDVGIYFFSYAISKEEAIEEANWCINKLKQYGMESKCKYIAFDFEVYNSGRAKNVVTKTILNANATAFLNQVYKNGYTPILYGNKTYLTSYFDTTKIVSGVKNCKVWLAQYNDKVTYEGEYDIWQYTSTGTVDGISGNVDLNIVYF